MSIFIDGLSWALLILGGFICVSGAIGMHRFPDFFSRMHAASVTDTLGGSLILVGLMLQLDGEYTVLVKLILIVLFILLTSPTASHALAKAALHGGLRPKLGSNQEEQDEDVLRSFGPVKSEDTKNKE
ncbi:monovalent cation/H(+) antiporter subunit G [Kangiella spongicola]|jgi:multicomponent Na+:H+ antiporter subunit G|uniref:Sodium:proton antiporter n=1 Tax=Kangiella spongicola TaxID=796379 RepID=A0A318D9Y3_9GAMM|nr:monovalent cation/H(+) antiporter subunit G [Kangiella spongicola]MBV34462.1 sodium:proton antiporter [Rickettsiales bacterium]PXF63707.1 sodium:proton antiporter [Kangiella spongicola]